jgi:DNA polymerase
LNREEIIAAIRIQIEQERRHGVSLWCDADLAAALRATAASGAARTSDAVAAPATVDRSAQLRALRSAIQPQARMEGGAGRAPARLNAAPLSPAPPRPMTPAASSAGSTSAAPRTPAARPQWGPPPGATGRGPDWEQKLAALEAEAKGCRLCGLCEDRHSVVFGVGRASVPLVFVGEAPGAEEDRQGLPFVGRAGELLTKIIQAIGLSREQVYICNVLKCRPPGNRDPLPDEVATCAPYLQSQLSILKPKVICTLGRHSTMLLTGQALPMRAVRGQVFDYHGWKVVPTYHPAALLRNPSLKSLVWEDVQKVRALLDAQA